MRQHLRLRVPRRLGTAELPPATAATHSWARTTVNQARSRAASALIDHAQGVGGAHNRCCGQGATDGAVACLCRGSAGSRPRNREHEGYGVGVCRGQLRGLKAIWVGKGMA